MNADTGQIYTTDEEIEAAQARKERLIFGTLEELEEKRAVILNRGQRRLQARLERRERKRGRR